MIVAFSNFGSHPQPEGCRSNCDYLTPDLDGKKRAAETFVCRICNDGGSSREGNVKGKGRRV